MEVHKHKCSSCGSNKLEKIEENAYKCKYCGTIYYFEPKSSQQGTQATDMRPVDVSKNVKFSRLFYKSCLKISVVV